MCVCVCVCFFFFFFFFLGGGVFFINHTAPPPPHTHTHLNTTYDFGRTFSDDSKLKIVGLPQDSVQFLSLKTWPNFAYHYFVAPSFPTLPTTHIPCTEFNTFFLLDLSHFYFYLRRNTFLFSSPQSNSGSRHQLRV